MRTPNRIIRWVRGLGARANRYPTAVDRALPTEQSSEADDQRIYLQPVVHRDGVRRCVVVGNTACINPQWFLSAEASPSANQQDTDMQGSLIPLFRESPHNEALLGLLEPVDWASVQTLAYLSQLSPETVLCTLHDLERVGKVKIGTRRVPPEVRTIAWLANPKQDAIGPA